MDVWTYLAMIFMILVAIPGDELKVISIAVLLLIVWLEKKVIKGVKEK